MQNKVFVIDATGKPLLPTSSARARLLLKRNRAEVECMIPFTIRLQRIVEKPTGEFSVGVDDGSKHVGVAIVNDFTREAVFVGEIRLRQDVKRFMKRRAGFRRTRRSRKLRHRKPRFNNRIGPKLAPSIRTRKESTVRFVRDMQKRINITRAVIEEVSSNRRNRWFSLVMIGKTFLREQLTALGLEVEVVKGWMTASWREATGTPKSHGNDAVVIIGRQQRIAMPRIHFKIIPRRTRTLGNPPRKNDEKLGFRHWDIVKAERAGKLVVGQVRSLKAKQLTLRTAKCGNYPVVYSKAKLFWRPKGLVYLPGI